MANSPWSSPEVGRGVGLSLRPLAPLAPGLVAIIAGSMLLQKRVSRELALLDQASGPPWGSPPRVPTQHVARLPTDRRRSALTLTARHGRGELDGATVASRLRGVVAAALAWTRVEARPREAKHQGHVALRSRRGCATDSTRPFMGCVVTWPHAKPRSTTQRELGFVGARAVCGPTWAAQRPHGAE